MCFAVICSWFSDARLRSVAPRDATLIAMTKHRWQLNFMDRLVTSILMIVIHLKKRIKKPTVSLFICLIQDSFFFWSSDFVPWYSCGNQFRNGSLNSRAVLLKEHDFMYWVMFLGIWGFSNLTRVQVINTKSTFKETFSFLNPVFFHHHPTESLE